MNASNESQGRAQDRYRRARLTVSLGAVERIVGALSGALRVALLVRTLAPRDYGLYVAVFGIVATANLLDFGLHYGLLNAVSHASGRDDRGAIRASLSTGLVVYSVISVVALVALLPLSWFGRLDLLFGLSSDQVHASRVLVVLGFGGLLLTMPTKVATAGLVGTQRAFIPAAYRTISNGLQLLALILVVLFWRSQLLPVVIAGVAVDLALTFGFLGWTSRRFPELRVSLTAAKASLVRPLLGTGLSFLLTNLANLFRRSLAAVVIAQALGTAVVAHFSVPFALFTIALGFSETISSSLWPAYGEAAARGDWAWVERAYRLGTRAALGAGFLFATLGVCAGHEVVSLWSSRVVSTTPAMLACFALWLVSQASTHGAATLLGGLGKNVVVLRIVAIEGVATLVGSVWAVRVAGVTGVVAVMAIAGCCGALALQAVAVPRVTEGRLRPLVGWWAGFAVISLASIIACMAIGLTLGGLPTVVRLLVFGTCATAVYASLAYAVVMKPSERQQARVWLARRVSRNT